MSKLIRNICFLLLLFGIGYISFTIIESFNLAEDTEHFGLDSGYSTTIELDEKRSFHLFVSELSYENEDAYNCSVSKNTDTLTSMFSCTSYLGSGGVEFDISVTSSDEVFYFDDMGNTKLTLNDRVAIGKIELEEGIEKMYEWYKNK